jgi:competence protein ComEC
MKFLCQPYVWFLGICCGILYVSCVNEPTQQYESKIIFLDIDQGDATWVDAEGHQMLIDLGPDSGSLKNALDRVNYPWQDTLDALWISHWDKDHWGGLSAIVSHQKIRRIWLSADAIPSQVDLSKIRAQTGATIDTLWAGDTLQSGPWKIHILHPFLSADSASQDGNEASLVMRMVWEDLAVLWTGDLDEKGEAEILASNPEISSQILKVAHHGSATSTSLAFLSEVQPWIAVISSGSTNTYGHPHPQTLAHLAQFLDSNQILRTDRQKDIRVDISPRGIRAWDRP